MTPGNLLKLLTIIPEGMTEFGNIARESGLSDSGVHDLIYLLNKNEIGHVRGEELSLRPGDRIRIALLAVSMGAGIDEVSAALGWRDFEDFAAFILSENGFVIHRNFRLRTPRREIDILGLRDGLALAIDCKHWKKGISKSELGRIARDQVLRSEAVFSSGRAEQLGLSRILPTILTLHSDGVRAAHGVPVVPVNSFRDFILQYEGYLVGLTVVTKEIYELRVLPHIIE